jgi:proline iminopeptidase
MDTLLSNPLEPIEDAHIIRSGKLDVGDGHEIYWVDWGNIAVKEPIFYLHGGPGAGFSERDFQRFDPAKHRVVFHDQRGSSRSTPFAGTDHNTTQDLIADITKLRHALGFHKISLYGRSWGSTLALLYAIAYPEDINKMLVGGIFLARQVDNEFYFKGKVASHFPEAWERFSAMVPAQHKQNVSQYYKKMMGSGSSVNDRRRFAKEWMIYESSILKLDYVPDNIERSIAAFASESLAFLEAHYLLNNCFIDENFILDNISKLSTIEKIVIVHGRYDFICMPSAAYELRHALGDNALLHFVMSGHSGSDTVQREVEHAYSNILW